MANSSKTLRRRIENRDTAMEKLAPRMVEYLRNVIDTPIEDRGLDAEIARKMRITRSCVSSYKKKVEERLTKEELLEVCSEIMKEAA